MKKLTILAVALMVSVSVMSVLSDDVDAEQVSETCSNLMADVYIVPVDDYSSTWNPYVNGCYGYAIALIRGSAEESAFIDDLDNRRDLTGYSPYISEWDDTTWQYESKDVDIFVFLFDEYDYSYDDLYLYAAGRNYELNDSNLYMEADRKTHYLASGQTVAVKLDESYNGSLHLKVNGYRYSKLNVEDLSEGGMVLVSGNYALYTPSERIDMVYVTYTIEYETLPESNNTFGYAALAAGAFVIFLVVLFGRSQKIKG
ncbi:MAG: hypothetical protein GX137_05050 [Thermoplasmatales archaeon]|nr:hypothetical protein [Thermoplasmatales archaeon]